MPWYDYKIATPTHNTKYECILIKRVLRDLVEKGSQVRVPLVAGGGKGPLSSKFGTCKTVQARF